MNLASRSGRPPLRVVLEFKDGTTVCQNDIMAKARLFDRLLASASNQELASIEQAISELRLGRIDRQQAERSLSELKRLRKEGPQGSATQNPLALPLDEIWEEIKAERAEKALGSASQKEGTATEDVPSAFTVNEA